MDDRPGTSETYRPWTMVVLAGLGLAAAGVYAGQALWVASSGRNWSLARYILPVLVVAGLLAWSMGNRLKLSPDSLDSRYLWQWRRLRRRDIAYVHDIRPIGNATSVTFVLHDERAIAVTWSGAAGKALAAWCQGLLR